MANKITCTCGHSWDKSDSSKKDATVCHICGKNNMKDGGWLNKYEAPQAQNGIEGTMGGLTDKGFNYNGAWGGPSMQMGGSMPGAVGFTYARTQGAAPSNGPYAKKTKASAQNGAEMSFYQNGLDWTPRNISQDGTYVKKPRTDMLTMDEYRLKKALANQPVIQSPKGKQLTKEQIFAKNKQTAEAQGKRFNPETGAVTPFLSSSKAKTFERASENIVEPMITMSPMGEVGMVNDVMKLAKPIASNIHKLSKSFISDAANKLGVGAAKALFTAQKILPAGIVKDNLLGAAYGVRDVAKGRPFFETFPITGKQRRAVEATQDKAFNEGLDFVKDWNYPNNSWKIRPEVEARIEAIYPDLYSSPTNMNDFSKSNPIFNAKNLLVNSKTIPVLKNKSLSEEAKDYIFRNRGTIGGVNMGATDESITLRNHGLYYMVPEDIKNVAAHELGHSMQKLGSVYGDDWGKQIAKYDYPNYKYQIPNTSTPFGKQMGEAMVEPVKGEYTWEASPLEPHSELMVARMKAYDNYKNTYGSEKAMEGLQNPDDDLTDWLIKEGNLNRFFKPTTSQEAKRKIIKGLPAAIPAIGIGAAAATQQKKQGGEITKDDNGYWNPDNWGEPVEIGSNDITMQGVYEPLLGVSDTGDTQMMYPGEDYKFKGKKVTEYPIAQSGDWIQRAANANLSFWEKCRLASGADNGGGGRSGGGSGAASKYKNPYEEISDIKGYEKDQRKAFEKSLPQGVDIADWVAVNRDASRMNTLLKNPDYAKYTDSTGTLVPEYQNLATQFDPYYLYYKPAFAGKKEVTPEDVLKYQQSQPGGLPGYKELVNRRYMPEKKKNGGWLEKYK